MCGWRLLRTSGHIDGATAILRSTSTLRCASDACSPSHTRSRSAQKRPTVLKSLDWRKMVLAEAGVPQTNDHLRIAVVDDDPLFRETLTENLTDADFAVEAFDGGEPFFSWLNDGGEVDLVLLDWRMPDVNGIEVLRRLREDGSEVPVIFLTVLSEQIYEEAALHSGAVDFVEKSRSFAILRKRIDLILEGVKSPASDGTSEDDSLRRLGHLELNLDSSRAFWRGERVNLSLT